MASLIQGYNYDIRLLRRLADTADKSSPSTYRRKKRRKRKGEIEAKRRFRETGKMKAVANKN